MDIVRFPDFYADSKAPLSGAQILDFVSRKLVQKSRMDYLENYYLGRQDILDKVVADASQPCNKIVANYCKVIVDFYNTYLLGRPVQYKSANTALLDLIKKSLEYNDAHETDMQNNQSMNIIGAAAEQCYLDGDGEFRFMPVDYRNVIFVYNRSIDHSLHSVIKFWRYAPTDAKYQCEVWTKDSVYTYEIDEGLGQIRGLGKKSHNFVDIPFVEYPNNVYRLSSFADILSLQDAYNTLCSAEVDDYEAFVDAFLAIYNASGTKDDDIAAMKSNRVLLLDGESRAEWIVKNCNPAQIKQIKEEIVASIHKVASLPDLSDQNFSGNASGVAIKYKMVGAENVAARQERKFKKGLQRRLELLVGYLSKTENTEFDYLDIDITFNRNMIGADLEVAQLINLVGERIPIANLAAQLSFITEADMGAIKAADKSRLDPAKANPAPNTTPADPARVAAQQK